MERRFQESHRIDDSAAEDFIFSAAGGWRTKFRRELETDRSDLPTSEIYTYCHLLYPRHSNDYTSEEPSQWSRCGLLVRKEVEDSIRRENPIDSVNTIASASGLEPQRSEIDESLISEICNIFQECAEANWDGYDAKPISATSYVMALKIAESLPETMPRPSVIPETTGELAFEWYRGKQYVFILSFGIAGRYNYAGLFGSNSKIYGSENFSEDLPAIIKSHIQRLYR